jgi:hypothetical protein
VATAVMNYSTSDEHRPAESGVEPAVGALCAAIEAATIAAVWLAAIVAVPLLYGERSGAIWGGGIAVFSIVPLIAGLLRGQPSRYATWIAVGLLLACPAVYAITDQMSAAYETLRDVVFLATAGTVIFVSTGWCVSFQRSRHWAWMFASILVLVVAACSIAVAISLFMYLE